VCPGKTDLLLAVKVDEFISLIAAASGSTFRSISSYQQTGLNSKCLSSRSTVELREWDQKDQYALILYFPSWYSYQLTFEPTVLITTYCRWSRHVHAGSGVKRLRHEADHWRTLIMAWFVIKSKDLNLTFSWRVSVRLSNGIRTRRSIRVHECYLTLQLLPRNTTSKRYCRFEQIYISVHVNMHILKISRISYGVVQKFYLSPVWYLNISRSFRNFCTAY
jgi:hypothetical protein